jgi:hypothetical protein
MRKALFCNTQSTSSGATTDNQTIPVHSFAVSANDTHKDSDKVSTPLSLFPILFLIMKSSNFLFI